MRDGGGIETAAESGEKVRTRPWVRENPLRVRNPFADANDVGYRGPGLEPGQVLKLLISPTSSMTKGRISFTRLRRKARRRVTGSRSHESLVRGNASA